MASEQVRRDVLAALARIRAQAPAREAEYVESRRRLAAIKASAEADRDRLDEQLRRGGR